MRHESKVTDKHQTIIPKSARLEGNVSVGDTLVWEWDESKKQFIVTPVPSKVSEFLFQLGSEEQNRKNGGDDNNAI